MIVPLRVRTGQEWRALAPGASTGEPIFVPTTAPLAAGQAVVLEVASSRLPNKVLVRATVLGWRPALPRLRQRAGATLALAPHEQPKLTFLHEVFAGTRGEVRRRRHERLPVDLPVRYRPTAQAALVEASLLELGVGGALLSTVEPLPLDAEVILEVVPPGAAGPLEIACRVSYHVPGGGTGLRFLTRDVDGERRLRELVRRVRAA